MLKEGSVVIVVGKLDQRIRENTEEIVVGTIISIKNGKVSVVLSDGNIWVGNDWEVYEDTAEPHSRIPNLREE
jgi:transketolase N-terminal domain/subunit